MKKNIIIPIVAALMSVVFAVGIAVALDPSASQEESIYAQDCLDIVIVDIKEEFKEKFLSKGFIKEDFQWANIKTIVYLKWQDNLENECGRVHIYLSTSDEQQAKDAVNHLKTLEFIKDAGLIGAHIRTESIDVYIDSYYKAGFFSKSITKEDLMWDNIEAVRYDIWANSTDSGIICVFLKEQNARAVIKAVEHFNALEHVRFANWHYNFKLLDSSIEVV